MWRPLGFYLTLEACALVKDALLWSTGFDRRTCMGLTYFVRRGDAQLAARMAGGGGGVAGAEQAPMLLLHGVGMGLLPYLYFLANLAATGAIRGGGV